MQKLRGRRKQDVFEDLKKKFNLAETQNRILIFFSKVHRQGPESEVEKPPWLRVFIYYLWWHQASVCSSESGDKRLQGSERNTFNKNLP